MIWVEQSVEQRLGKSYFSPLKTRKINLFEAKLQFRTLAAVVCRTPLVNRHIVSFLDIFVVTICFSLTFNFISTSRQQKHEKLSSSVV